MRYDDLLGVARPEQLEDEGPEPPTAIRDADAKEIEAAGNKVPLTRRPSVPFTPGAPSDLVSANRDVA